MSVKEMMMHSMLERAAAHLDWVIQTMDFQNANTGIEHGQDSPELSDAKNLLAEIKEIL